MILLYGDNNFDKKAKHQISVSSMYDKKNKEIPPAKRGDSFILDGSIDN